jgi:transcription factor SPN1
MALNRKIDEIVRAPKNKRKKSKRADGEDDLDEVNDDLIVRLKEKMMAAAEKDEDAVMNKRPASAKLTMLRDVMSVLQQSVSPVLTP